MSPSIPVRPRRNRKSESIRKLVRETAISPSQLVLPIFVTEGAAQKSAITSLPDVYRLSVYLAVEEAKEASRLGIPALALFPVIPDAKKNPKASESANPDGLLQRCIREIKSACPEMLLMTDVAMDPYSSDGHDGLVQDGTILNDPTLEILARMAVAQARAGADFVAPSDMMDGRVGFIRKALDEEGVTEVGILSYAAKYASSFYGPFRDALDSAPKFGDKKTYQMDPANAREAVREVKLDEAEGADIVMVKPALSYLDVISRVRDCTQLPVAAYNVSGEYAMVAFAAQKGLISLEAGMMEILLSIRRAGADMIFTYFAKEAAKILGR